MTRKCWLYIYENRESRSIYIGVANSMERVWGAHNGAAEVLRGSPGTVILQTREPFSSREDAKKAEAIAIHVASFAEVTVHAADDDGTVFAATNVSGTRSTSELGPAVYVREGEVPLEELEQTLFVPLNSREDTGNLSAYGGHTGADFAPRAQEWWNVAPGKRSQVRRLVALLTGSGNLILGSWEVDPEGAWDPMPDAESQARGFRSRVRIPLVNSDEDNFGDIKGKRVSGLRMNSAVRYSPDIT